MLNYYVFFLLLLVLVLSYKSEEIEVVINRENRSQT